MKVNRDTNRKTTSRGNRINVFLAEELVADLQWLANLSHDGNRSATVAQMIREATEKAVKKGSTPQRRRSR